MANEGATKPTYSELESELLRVRGLLQRAYREIAESHGCRPSTVEARYTATSNLLAESADIGKLDAADEKGVEMGKVNRVDEYESARQEVYELMREVNKKPMPPEGEHTVRFLAKWLLHDHARQPKTLAGSAETGGEKAREYWPGERDDAPHPPNEAEMTCPGCARTYRAIWNGEYLFFERLSDAPARSLEARPGVEGAHEGTTADKSVCGYCGKPADDLLHTCRASHDYVDHDCHPFRPREPEKLNNAQNGVYDRIAKHFRGRINCTYTPEQVARCVEELRDGKIVKALAESSLSSPPPESIDEPWRKAGVLYDLPPDRCPECDHDIFISAGPTKYECYICSLEREIEWLRKRMLANFRQSPVPRESDAESAHSGKQNTADKSELLPTQLPKEKE